ncbi:MULTISPECIES: Hsp20/alpha crystallin family protein [Methanoculleus]|uniref:Heat shock protein Hsp20 n=2 Tax=Methanoculleus TaxID=45989 RepID=A3CX48_METMJ|nr:MULTISPECIES: Hsp20/alpha crystallin family protein [Methanoculleus]ABN57948.1 heat shock protein Hsp20 [Methanoculleus marisnigri JR1]MCC7556197.1 Hsp20/alpha crystallin family protein [Methanoculleus marisnigri]UYU19331.1 Hsp20/alpha crystallin family protein [Methanoculleus submarinus]
MTGREDDPSGPGRRQDEDQREDDRKRGRDFPGLTADFRVDILDHGDEVIVVAELPGAEEDEIRINLPNPQTLRITARRAGPVEEEPETYYIHERGDATLSRMIRLPASVTEEGAETGFKNGVLEVRLKKMRKPSGPGGKQIPIG